MKVSWKAFITGSCPPAHPQPWEVLNHTTGEVMSPNYKDSHAFRCLVRQVAAWDGCKLELRNIDVATLEHMRNQVKRVVEVAGGYDPYFDPNMTPEKWKAMGGHVVEDNEGVQA